MNTLLLILKSLPKDRLKALDKFIRSPYHVTHAGVVTLFETLKKNLDQPAGALKNTEDPKRLYHLSHYLLEAVEEFLALQQWESQPLRRHAATIESLRRLGLSEPAASMLRYSRKKLDQDPLRGLEYHEADFMLQREAYLLSMQQGRAKSFRVQELSDIQDIAFICSKLRTGCVLLSHQQVNQQTYDKGLLEHILALLDQDHPYLQHPAIAAYYHGYYAQSGGPDSNKHFSRLKILLVEQAHCFSIAEMHDLFLMAINFCIRKINQTDMAYYPEIFDLYRSGLQHGALLEDGVLSRWTYNNINSTALRLREFDWAQEFLHNYAPLLPEEHRAGATNFNLARYHYEKGELQAAMRHLLHIEYDDMLQNLSAKTMLVKIYYRLDESDALENQLDSIGIYIRRKKILGYHRHNYLEFVKYARKLLSVKWSGAKERARLRSEIEATAILPEKDWLLGELAA